MKDKEKQIEKMAKDLKECLPSSWYYLKSVDSDTYYVAKHFCNEGYRKLPEDSVVLSKEEYEKLTAPRLFIKQKPLREKELAEKLKNANYGIIGVDESSIEIIPTRAEIEKEMAKKILNKVDKESNGQTKQITDLIRKQSGVEIKE